MSSLTLQPGGRAASHLRAVPTQEAEPGPDTGLLCLVMMLKVAGKAADPDQIQHYQGQGGTRFSRDDIVRCARRLGVRAKAVKSKWPRLGRIHLPAIAEDKDGNFFILAKVGDEKVLIQNPAEPHPAILPRDKFEELWSRTLILIVSRAQLAGSERPFDVTWFIPAIVRYRKLLGEVLIASFFVQLFALVTPLFFQVVIDKVLVHKGLTTLDVLVIGLITVSVFEVVLNGLRTYVFSHTTNRVDVELGARLFDHLLSLPMAYFEARRVGDTVARVRELENIRSFLTGNAMTLVLDLFFTVVFLSVMYFYSPTLTYIVLGAIPFYAAVSIGVTPVLRRRLEERFYRGAENNAFLVESITGVETFKAMAVEPQSRRRWEDQLAAYVRASFRANVMGVVGSQGISLIHKITVALTLWFGARMVIQGELTVGQLIAFNMLAARVAEPVLRLSRLWQDFQQVRISIQRLGDILNAPAEPAYNPNRATLPDIKGRVTFDQVTFRYRPDGPEILRGISLEVAPGEVVGVVGPSGSGKSTLAKLIQRMYVPEKGRVLVDGVDLAMVDPAWLRRQIGVVLQDSMLFNRTVRENIGLADPTMPMERVIEAAKLAGAHDFILQLPEGYDTRIEERGANLSGGQRQRLAIARALVTDPSILIFDEATSALDAESEELIQQNMKDIARDRTVLIITHRLSALRIANRILTIEAGQIVEDGTHKQLLGSGGRYADLFRRQIRGYVDV